MKLANKKLVILAIFTAVLAGLATPFNAAMYSFIFKIIETKHLNWIVPFVVVIILGFVVFSIATYFNTVVINKNVVVINQRLKACLLQGLLLRRTVNDKNFVTQNLSFFMNDLKLLEDNYIRQLFSLISVAVTCVVTLAYSLANSVSLTLIFVIFMAFPTVIPRLFRQRITQRTANWSQQNGRWSSILKDALKGALAIRQYRAGKGMAHKTTTAINQVEHANAEMKNEIALSNAVVDAIFYVCTLIPIGIGIYLTILGHVSLSEFVAIQYSSNWIINSANQVVNSFNTLNSTVQIRQRIHETLKPMDAVTPAESSFDKLVLRDVSFSRGETPVLMAINLQVSRGENILIQGESGSGKTTLLRLIDGALTPTSGQIVINDQRVSHFGGMSTVNQTPIVFNDTLRFNLTLGMSFPDDVIRQACQEAGLASVINRDGLDYQIGDEGENLSGGQIKRLEIARAILFDRGLILIDEGTASLDEQTSIAIHKTILRLQKTIVEVDHHIPPEVLPLFDRVYTLHDGRLIANH
ncbi:ATP-binding cassette domain-containing protein [Levilactobacillus yiduensis]|uniref:ATP-binding cassette domain-containing protein n=1 Tax=Levilactobacillus yiduensis TaxID=2953880 RepID=UPI000EF33C12|nr:ABC transporter ATP-binding protein [Levilactobacillus yiduensis]AYM02943.1 ABC transporter ATP-binding protein [Levilactobacillus brevis]